MSKNVYSISPLCTPLTCTIDIPGDKSITHRAILIGAISRGEMVIVNPSLGKDSLSSVDAVRSLGVDITIEDTQIRIRGQGISGLRAPAAPIDVGNSGTTIRLLSGILAGMPFDSELTGDASIQRRPMKRIIDPLIQMGAHITSRPGGRAPLGIRGRKLHGIHYEMPIASAQVKSCLLLAAQNASGVMSITEPVPSRDHTERLLTYLGGSNGCALSNAGEDRDFSPVLKSPKMMTLVARDITVPGDLSSAAFWIGAGAIIPESVVTIKGVGINPTRCGLLTTLREMGAAITVSKPRYFGYEPVGDLVVQATQLNGVTVPAERIPLMIDEIPILAVIATQATSPTVFEGISELRHKESDRIAAMADGFRNIGIETTIAADSLTVYPGRIDGGEIQSMKDHRIAMCFSIAALVSDRGIVVRDAECVDISYPNFYTTLRAVGGDLKIDKAVQDQ